MKKFLFLICTILITVSCSDDTDESNTLPISDKIVGEWVYDHIDDEGVWETMKFTSSGVFYYSNINVGWKFSNDTNDGRYWVEDGNRLTGIYTLNGVSANIQMTFKNISDYSFTASFNDGADVGTFTYSRLIDKVKIKPGQTITPSYSALVPSGINGYKSHKTSVAFVDASSGAITAVAAGHTYIDVVTDEGTAVIEVISFDEDNMFEDFSFALTKTIPEIVSIKGDTYLYRDDENGLVYASDDYLCDTVRYITGAYDKTHVEFVELILNDNVSSAKIKESLDNKYELISTINDIYSYKTDKNVNDLPMVLSYYKQTNSVVFFLLQPSDLWLDCSYLFGQTDNTVYNEMKEWGYTYYLSDYSYSKDGSDYYLVNGNDYVTMIGFVFNTEKKMCEYWAYLYESVDQKSVYNYLNYKYKKADTECTKSQYVFYDAEKRLKVVFDASGYVSYTDTQQTPFVSSSNVSSVTLYNKTIPKRKTFD